MNSYYLLWSGGLDSTYLLLQLLEKGYPVRAGYVLIDNNFAKAATEQEAIANIIFHLEEKFPDTFQYDGIIYAGANNTPHKSKLRLKQVPYFLHALLIAPITDFRCMGYVKGDSAIKLLPGIRTAYNAFQNIYQRNLPPLLFPLKDISKSYILQDMQKHYPEIYRYCVWCENPRMPNNQPCQKCTPCLRFAKEQANVL